jgi:hypothetical protein
MKEKWLRRPSVAPTSNSRQSHEAECASTAGWVTLGCHSVMLMRGPWSTARWKQRGHGATATATTHDQVVHRGSAHSGAMARQQQQPRTIKSCAGGQRIRYRRSHGMTPTANEHAQGARGFEILPLHPGSMCPSDSGVLGGLFHSEGLGSSVRVVDDCCRRSHFRPLKFWASFL